MIVAHGIDLVDIRSVERLLSLEGDHYLVRCFTYREQQDAGDGSERAARLAGRFAVKEAVMKALGTGFGQEVGFLDIETVTNTVGAPAVRLSGHAREIADAKGISSWLVSTSHDGAMAIASVIGLEERGAKLPKA